MTRGPDRDARLRQAVALRESGQFVQACEALVPLAKELPEDAEVWYQCAWAHDRAGLEAEAVPFYEHALAVDGLDREERVEALLGLGSTYRLLGRTGDAVRLLDAAVAEFPEHDALRVFLALAHFDAGAHRVGFGSLLQVLLDTNDDGTVAQFRRPLGEHARDYVDGPGG